jgi:hypothetical protein
MKILSGIGAIVSFGKRCLHLRACKHKRVSCRLQLLAQRHATAMARVELDANQQRRALVARRAELVLHLSDKLERVQLSRKHTVSHAHNNHTRQAHKHAHVQARRDRHGRQ